MSLTHEEWIDSLHKGDLLGVTCTECKTTYGTPFVVCNECGNRDLQTTVLSTEGKVYSETMIRVPPAGTEGSYQVGIVQLDSARVMARFIDNVSIDDSVIFDDTFEINGDAVPAFRIK